MIHEKTMERFLFWKKEAMDEESFIREFSPTHFSKSIHIGVQHYLIDTDLQNYFSQRYPETVCSCYMITLGEMRTYDFLIESSSFLLRFKIHRNEKAIIERNKPIHDLPEKEREIVGDFKRLVQEKKENRLLFLTGAIKVNE